MATFLHYQQHIVDEAGDVISGADVEIRNEHDGLLTTIWTDETGSTTTSNPLTSNSSGYVSGYLRPGLYEITATSGAFTRTWENVSVSGSGYDFSAETVAEMKEGNYVIGARVQTFGYSSVGDGGSNLYEIVAGGTGTADGGRFIDLDSGLQAKGLFPNKEVVPEQFGGTQLSDILFALDGWEFNQTGPKAGFFVFDDSDLSTEVTNDPEGGIYVPLGSDLTGASGAWVRQEAHYVTPEMFGAVSGSDAATAIQAAIDSGYLVVATDTYEISTMLEIDSDEGLLLGPNAEIKRTSALSASTDPVIWLRGNRAFLGGRGSSSQILTENRCPLGVVRIGMEDMTSDHGAVNWCTVKDMWIAGSTQFGQTTGSNDAALMICNPQLTTNTSYFHTLDNVFLANANYGLWLRGWANANKISNIFLQRIGNTSLGNIGVYVHGGLDNAISNVFFHGSTDSTFLVFEDNDNTGVSGGNLHVPNLNSFRGMSAEHGGTTEKFIIATSTTASGNYIEGVANTTQFGNISDSFRYNNTIITNRLTIFQDQKPVGDGSELTISSGEITIQELWHSVDTEADAASDDLETINGGVAGDVITLTSNNGARTVVVKDSIGNIILDGGLDFSLDSTSDTIRLLYNGTNWLEVGRANNS